MQHQYGERLTPLIKTLLPNLHAAVMRCGLNANQETVNRLDKLATTIEALIEDYELVEELDSREIGQVTNLIIVVNQELHHAGISLYSGDK